MKMKYPQQLLNRYRSGGIDYHTYSLVSGAGAIDNGAFTIVGDQLKINASLIMKLRAPIRFASGQKIRRHLRSHSH